MTLDWNPTDLSTTDFRIGDFVVSPLLKTVEPVDKDGDAETAEPRRLPDKAMDVLVYLAGRARQVCLRGEILDAVWGEDREVTERVVDNAIRDIRRALGEEARNSHYVLTIPKRGYRLLAKAVPAEPSRAPESPRPAELSSSAATEQPETPPVRAEAYSGRARLSIWILISLVASGALWLGHRSWQSSIGKLAVTIRQADRAHLTPFDEETLREAVLETHPCDEQNLFVAGRPLGFSDVTVQISATNDSGGTKGIARIEGPAGHFAVVSTYVPALSAAKTSWHPSFTTDIRRELDRLACRTEGLASRARACHCLASAERPITSDRPVDRIADLETAHRLAPDLLDVYPKLASAYFKTGDSVRLQETVVEAAERLASIETTNALELRRELHRMNHDEAAVWQLTQELKRREPDNPLRDVEVAKHLTVHRSECLAALEILEPLAVEGAMNLYVQMETARSLLSCGQVQRSIDTLESLLDKTPRNADLRLWLVVIYTGAGRYQEAEALVQEVLALDPDDFHSFWALGGVAHYRGRYTKATYWANRAQELAVWPVDHFRLAHLKGSIALARREFDTCLSVTAPFREPIANDSSTLITRAACQMKVGRFEEARSLLDRLSVGGRTVSAGVRTAEGIIAVKAGPSPAVARADEAFTAAILLHPGSAFAAYEAGSAFDEVGLTAHAKSYFRRALDINPNHPWTLCYFGLVHRREGRLDEAVDHMRRSLDVFGNPPEDPLGMECAEALAELDPTFEVARW